jgi:Fic family protein
MDNMILSLSPDLVKLITEMDEFKGRWYALKTRSPERLKALKYTATIESIGSSTRIEGVTLTDRQVETLLSNLHMSEFKSRDEQEVAGYAEAMDLVFQAYEDLRPTENHIKQLHQLLLKHSDKDERHRGYYKKLANHVVAKDAKGNEVRLRRTQTTFLSQKPDWEPWLGFFLRCLKKQKDRLQQRLEIEEPCNKALPSLSLAILKLLSHHERLTIADIVSHTGANQNTLKVRLRELVELGQIQRCGKAKATWYTLM